MDVDIVVDFSLENPKYLSLHFCDLSTILYRFYKFTDLNLIVHVTFAD